MLFLISYKFTDANAQDKGSKMLKEWYDKGGPQNRPDGYNVKSWIFLPQHGSGYSVVDADSLETIWKQWRPWRELLEFTIEPCADLDQTVALYCISDLSIKNNILRKVMNRANRAKKI